MRLPPISPHADSAVEISPPAPTGASGPAAPVPGPAGAAQTGRASDFPHGGVRRLVRPSAVSVMSLPGYVRTQIAPMPVDRDQRMTTATGRGPASGPRTLRRIDDMADSLTRKLHPGATPTPASGVGAVLRDAGAFATAVAALFPRAAEPAQPAAALAAALLDLAPGDDAARPARFAGAWQVALALAGTGADAAQAGAALDHLRQGYTLDDGADQSDPPTPAQRHAWHAARLLGHTPTGFDALLRMIGEAGAPSSPADRQLWRESLRTFLQAAHQLAAGAEGQARTTTPSAQLRHARGRLTTFRLPSGPARSGDALAIGALLCAARLRAAPHATAEDIGDAAQVADYVAWRSGFRHDGAGTPLAHTRARLAKFGTWARRAGQRAAHPGQAWHPARLFGLRKSPLTALVRGDGGATLPLLTQQAALYRQAVHDTIDTLLLHQRALLGRPVTQAQRATLRLREQALLHWKASPSQQLDRIDLGDGDRLAIGAAARMAALHDARQPALGPDPRALAGLGTLNLGTLQRWAGEAARMGAAGPLLADVRQRRQHAVTLRRAARATPRRDGGMLEALHQRLRDVIDHTPLGNNVRYFDGGMYGLNANMTLNPHAFSPEGVKLGLPLAFGAKAKRGRYAFVEVGSSSYGGEVYLGTDTRHATGAALGLFAGAAVGVRHAHLAAGAGLGAAYSHDQSASRGVIVRSELQRDAAGVPTDSWRRQAAAVADFLFERAAAGGAGEHWQRFSARFFRDTDISVDWRDQRRSSQTLSAIATLTARVSVASLHAGPSLSASHDRLLAGKNQRVDANGWLRGIERSRARSSSTTLTASLLGGTSGIGHFSSHAAHPESLSLPGVPLLGVAVAVAPAGASVTLRMVEDRDGFNPKLIRRLVEFLDPAAFAAYAESNRPRLQAGPLGLARHDAYIHQIRRGATRGNQSFGASSKLRPEIAELITAHHSELTMRRLTGPGDDSLDPRRARLEGEIVRLLGQADNWKASAYYSYEMNTDGYNAGPSMLLEATAGTWAVGERMLTELAFAELEALDDPERAGAVFGGDH